MTAEAAGIRRSPASSGIAAATGWIAHRLTTERDRWPLWMPVAMGAGVALYFALPLEPSGWTGPLILLALLPTPFLGLFRDRMAARGILIVMILAALGFSAAQWRTARIAAPMLMEETGFADVTGRVVSMDRMPDGVRVVLGDLSIEDLPPEETPDLVRVRLRSDETILSVGDRIGLLAVLLDPSGPASPGAYDFRRHAFFEGIGGIGYGVSHVEILEEGGDPPALPVETLRQAIGDRVAAILEGETAAIAIALMNGERGAISDETNQAMRDSGLAHLLSISGLHVSLITALVFGAVRGGLAAIEPLALRRPIKKWAAFAALLGALAYTVLVGAPVPTQRAFLMTAIVMLAIMVDRNPFSMRLIACAAMAVLLWAPDSMMGASFQMSFGAVVALIACYEASSDRIAAFRRNGGRHRVVLLYLASVALTTLVATLATSPFGIFHFQRISTYGLVANLVVVPLTSIWIMPLILVAYLLMPFGLEALALVPMGWGIDAMLRVAALIASWPGSAFTIPVMPFAGLLLIVFGGLWLCLWRGRWRLWGAGLFLAGLMTPLLPTDRPDILVNEDARLIAVRDHDGALTLSSGRADSFTRDMWLRRNGQEEFATWPKAGANADGSLSCDPRGCLYRPAQGPPVAIAFGPEALMEDCGRVDIIIAATPIPYDCPAAHMVGRFDVWRTGPHAVTIRPDGRVDIESAADWVGDRPWALRRGQ